LKPERNHATAILKEPLTHFLLIGAAMFLFFQLGGGRKAEKPNEIVVTRGAIESLASAWRKTRQRPPTTAELEGLIESYIRQEVLYREALAMGLDREDTIIKRRLGQKMTFLFEDVTDLAEIGEEELQQFLAENAGRYRIEPEYTFSHVYLNADRRGAAVEEDAWRILGELRGSPLEETAAALGDPFLLSYRYESLPRGDVKKLFGAEFAEGISSLEPGGWEGPLRSGYGLHLVLVRERTEERLPELAEVRDAVARDYSARLREENSRKFYERLRERYTITVEPLAEPAGTAKAESPE
jgi:hypothetical protein